MYNTILTEKKEGVGIITFNRPETYNAYSLEMRTEFAQILDEMEQDPEIKAIIVTGAGEKAFCAGGDVKQQAAGFDVYSGRDRVRNGNRTLMKMVRMNKPIICAVNGLAIGVGTNLALASDIIIAVKEAKFSEIYINMGLVPDFGGAHFLPRAIGLARAKELVFTGRMVDAQEAKEMGLINRVVPREELMPTAFEMARTIAKRSAKALALDKDLLNRSLDLDLATNLELEEFAMGLCFQSEEH
ncbi:MAG TPA: enoyl-CoA hydratase/isomerase family protein, partial [Syntrophomonas sp.]|nr:enoyl-CoA hydratase/isomerase family protein [Syntrophomonas sp.]